MFNLNIHNFRSFQNQSFNFSRINILIGENSGGKSSLLKFLLSLKQTIDSPDETNLNLKGDYTDLGNFEEVVYQKKKQAKIKFAFAEQEKYNDYFKKILSLYKEHNSKNDYNFLYETAKKGFNSPTKIEFTISRKLDDHSSIKTLITNKSIGFLKIVQVGEKTDDVFKDLKCNIEFDFNGIKGNIENCTAVKEGFFTLLAQSLKSKCEDKYPDNYSHIYHTCFYLLMIQNYISKKIEQIKFVNPISNSPKRFYFQEDKKSSYKMIDIEKFINIIGDKTLTKKEYNDRINLLNKTIKEFGIAEEIEIIKDDRLPILALNVKTKSFWSNITDVGFGVSLQIPILFQALLSENYTKEGQTILIEQPEVHLHPSLQAKFIETLASIGNKNSYFIETHSEHIIRKLQVLVKKEMYGLKPEDITIHYFKREPEKFNISSHKILKNGKLSSPFPDGFYDTSYSLVKELL